MEIVNVKRKNYYLYLIFLTILTFMKFKVILVFSFISLSLNWEKEWWRLLNHLILVSSIYLSFPSACANHLSVLCFICSLSSTHTLLSHTYIFHKHLSLCPCFTLCHMCFSGISASSVCLCCASHHIFTSEILC